MAGSVSGGAVRISGVGAAAGGVFGGVAARGGRGGRDGRGGATAGTDDDAAAAAGVDDAAVTGAGASRAISGAVDESGPASSFTAGGRDSAYQPAAACISSDISTANRIPERFRIGT